MMSGLEIAETVDHENKLENSPRKRLRHRKRQLYENILKQLEFYFSDANLTKDRYLGDLVKNDPFIPLETFLKFNKIRSMTQDVNDIAKAIKYSTLLELSDDKLKVKRKSPVLPYDADSRTIYVESIPVTATQEWLERVFSSYGQVAYVSLPKFKNSQRIKGFAFIEFSTPEEAQKCVNKFGKMGCKLPTCMPPEELSSIKMFSVDEPLDVITEKDEHEPPKKKKKNKDKKLNKDLELKFEEFGERSAETLSEENKSVTTPTEENKAIDTESKDEMTSQDESRTDQGTPRKKKSRKRTAKERNKETNLTKNNVSKGALSGLQVLSKSEWKQLRNKYLNLQRKYMKEMKSNVQNSRHSYCSIPAPAAPSVEVEPAINSAEVGTNSIATMEKIPGVFVKETLAEPCFDVRLTKRTIRTNIHALHVDAKEGQSEVIIRFDSAKAADEYCANSSSGALVLAGADEQEQWARAAAARGARGARGGRRGARGARGARRGARAPASPQPTHTHILFEDE